MELREYYRILKSHLSVIIYTAAIVLVAVYAWSIKASERFNGELLLNIGRLDYQRTADYHFDQFYRIQADEKFGQTIEEWLASAGVSSEIFAKSEIGKSGVSIGQLAKSFHAERISPETVKVRFSASSEDEAKKIASAIETVIGEKTEKLNNQSQDPNWFRIDAANLIILKNIQDLRINLGLAILGGLLLGSFFALVKHYLSEEN